MYDRALHTHTHTHSGSFHFCFIACRWCVINQLHILAVRFCPVLWSLRENLPSAPNRPQNASQRHQSASQLASQSHTHTRTHTTPLSVLHWDSMALAIWHTKLRRQAARWGKPGEQASVILSVTFYLLCMLHKVCEGLFVKTSLVLGCWRCHSLCWGLCVFTFRCEF